MRGDVIVRPENESSGSGSYQRVESLNFEGILPALARDGNAERGDHDVLPILRPIEDFATEFL